MGYCTELPPMPLETCEEERFNSNNGLTIKAFGEAKKIFKKLIKQYQVVQIYKEGDVHHEDRVEEKPLVVVYKDRWANMGELFEWEFTSNELQIF